jgi:hypothetical protein
MPPRKEKSLRLRNATAVSPAKAMRVTDAALWTAPGALRKASHSRGTKTTASATTNPASARYWVVRLRARWATRLAIQLTMMNAPSTSNQETPSIARAIRSASPEVKSQVSSRVKATMAPNRCR